MSAKDIPITVTAGQLAELDQLISSAIKHGSSAIELLTAKVRVRRWMQPTFNAIGDDAARQLLGLPPMTKTWQANRNDRTEPKAA